MRPRRRMSGPPFVPIVTPSSLDVLDLLAEPLDGRLPGEADPGQLHVGRLRTKRIGFPVQLLAEEIEPSSNRTAPRQQLARGADMHVQPVDLLADVGLAGEERRLLRQDRKSTRLNSSH